MSGTAPQLASRSGSDDSDDDEDDPFASPQPKKSRATKQANVNQPRLKLSKGVPQKLNNDWNEKKRKFPRIEENDLQIVAWINTEVQKHDENVRDLVRKHLDVLTGMQKPAKRIRKSSPKSSEGQDDKEAKKKKKEETKKKKDDNQFKRDLKLRRIQQERDLANQQLLLYNDIKTEFITIEQSIENEQTIEGLENLYNNNNNQMENINKINDKRSRIVLKIILEENKKAIMNKAPHVGGGLHATWFINEQNRSGAASIDDQEEDEEITGKKKRPGRGDITKIKDVPSMKQSIKLSLKAINKNAIKICNLQKQIQERSMKINDEPRANNEPTEEIIDMMNTADELLEKYKAKLRDIRNAKQRQQQPEVDNHVIKPIFQCCIYDGDSQIHHIIVKTAGSMPTRLVFEAENGKN